MIAIPAVRVLHGFTSPETAHFTFAYPFGNTRCVRREWIERAAKGQYKGHFRLVTQTTVKSFNQEYTSALDAHGPDSANTWAECSLPARGPRAWNAPKPGNYVFFAVMVERPLEDGSGRLGVGIVSLRPYDGPERVLEFEALVGEQLDEQQRALFDRIAAFSRRSDPAAWAKAEAAPIAPAGECVVDVA